MNSKELHKKYLELLIENNNLKEEIKRLKTPTDDLVHDRYDNYVSQVNDGQNEAAVENPLTYPSSINKRSDSAEKVRLFMYIYLVLMCISKPTG